MHTVQDDLLLAKVSELFVFGLVIISQILPVILLQLNSNNLSL